MTDAKCSFADRKVVLRELCGRDNKREICGFFCRRLEQTRGTFLQIPIFLTILVSAARFSWWRLCRSGRNCPLPPAMAGLGTQEQLTPSWPWATIPVPSGAEVAELADARDSKSRGPRGHGGSTPPFGTNRFNDLAISLFRASRIICRLNLPCSPHYQKDKCSSALCC